MEVEEQKKEEEAGLKRRGWVKRKRNIRKGGSRKERQWCGRAGEGGGEGGHEGGEGYNSEKQKAVK